MPERFDEVRDRPHQVAAADSVNFDSRVEAIGLSMINVAEQQKLRLEIFVRKKHDRPIALEEFHANTLNGIEMMAQELEERSRSSARLSVLRRN